MELTTQRRLAGKVLKCSPKRVWIDSSHLSDVKEAITKADIRNMVIKGYVQVKPKNSNSKGRIRKRHAQKRKGRRQGHGKRRGTQKARIDTKTSWINRVRKQRAFLKNLIEKKYIENKIYRELYRKSKGGFFRSERHIKLYMDEHKLGKKK